ncbi:hypothetical protein [Shewanella sp.]|uniref:hypothetical protein n=1 Tax=Shewanella sp. TaxID=50422 RepID=UPI0040546459
MYESVKITPKKRMQKIGTTNHNLQFLNGKMKFIQKFPVPDNALNFETINIEGAIEHVRNVQSVGPARGIVGGHDRTIFLGLGDICQFIDFANTDINGVEVVSYHMYSKNQAGQRIQNRVNVVTGLPIYRHNAQVFTKTIYDPLVWTEQRLKESLISALDDAIERNVFVNTGSFRANDEYNNLIEFWMRDGVLQTFYFVPNP